MTNRPLKKAILGIFPTRNRKNALSRFLHFQPVEIGGTSLCRTQAVAKSLLQRPANHRRLLLFGAISAVIHACMIIAAAPWIDPPRPRPPARITLTVVRIDPPEPRPEPHSDDEPTASAEDQPESPSSDEGIRLENAPAQAANAASVTRPPHKTSSTKPDKRAPQAAPDRNTRPEKNRVAAAKVEKPKKPPRRASAKPKRQKQKSKESAQARPTTRKRVDKKGASSTGDRNPPARKSTKAGSSPKAAGGKIREPIPRANPRPRYPRSARRRGLEGKVVLEVLVNAGGRVEQCRVRKSSGHGILDNQALKTVRKWTFKPGSKGGTPTAMWVKAPIRFELE